MKRSVVRMIREWAWLAIVMTWPEAVDLQLLRAFAFNLQLLLELAIFPEAVGNNGDGDDLQHHRGWNQPGILVNQVGETVNIFLFDRG